MASSSSANAIPVLVMGVCGTGKTTVAQRVAQAVDGVFLDADDFHPPENVAHMAAGLPLNDEMRWDWLDLVAKGVIEAGRDGRTVVFACSALKHSYRDRLRQSLGVMHLAHLTGPRDLIAQRMAARENHYMPIALLDSQLADLEMPGPDEAPLSCDIREAPEALCAQILNAWGLTAPQV
ncbi:gluconokinase [Thioclava sp. ES.031]|uniref:gluconokinase n=1 Tax=Thioclava sp. ES.031 TaxID=1798203 RepID=UPI000C00BBF0|nr:gluconokinase [Thioclava sp. ES.031]PFG62334.1 gluconokinase [Thioclava sp. ES.031]